MNLTDLLSANWTGLFLLVAVGVMVLAGVIARSQRLSDGRRWALAVAFAGLITAAVLARSTLVRVLLLDLAALSTVGLVWMQNTPAGRRYLAAVVAGSLLAGAGMALCGLFGPEAVQPAGIAARAAVALLMVGFALKLALVPFYFWLTAVTEGASTMTSVLVICVLDMAEVAELVTLRSEVPWVFTDFQGVWIGLSLLALLGGALLALAQKSLRRMLAFSAIDDSGYLLLGIAAGTTFGLGGALVGILSHALCKFLLFAAVGNAEQMLNKPLTLDQRGLSTCFPVSSAAFMVGALGMVGVPPLLGSAGRWRLYFSGVEMGGVPLAAVMAVGSILALLYYVRAIHRVWLGAPLPEEADLPGSAQGCEPRSLVAALVIVSLVVVLAGLWLNFGAVVG